MGRDMLLEQAYAVVTAHVELRGMAVDAASLCSMQHA